MLGWTTGFSPRFSKDLHQDVQVLIPRRFQGGLQGTFRFGETEEQSKGFHQTDEKVGLE